MEHQLLTIQEYTRRLGSDKPCPGGGSAAAIVTAEALALCEMVCRINAKKKKSNPQFWNSQLKANRFANAKSVALKLSDQDAQAFGHVSRVWKQGGVELQSALKLASSPPLSLAKLCVQNAELALEEITPTSKHLISDLSEAGLLFKAAFYSAVMNVKVNLFSIEDKAFGEEIMGTLKLLTNRIEQSSQTLIQSFDLKHRSNN